MDPKVRQEIISVLESKKAAMESGDHFKMLDLTDAADDAAVKAAYFRLARLVHPDSLKKADLDDRRAEAISLFKRITEAQEILLDPARKKAWLQSRAAGGAKPTDPAVSDEQAKIAMHQGRLLINRRAWPQAQEVLTRYVQIKPDDVKGLLLLGWCIFQNQSLPLEARLEEARKSFARALKLDDKNPDVHYHMALYFKEKGDTEQLSNHINKALKHNPEHVGAVREKRLLEMRGGVAPKESVPGPSVGDRLKGFFAGFVKKK